ncbi:MAG: hypothetical protein C0412_12800 [Flavobacterium sp.]|nr:hypothetical protein [Flavobacterium sp.]
MKRSLFSSLFPMFIFLFLVFAGCKKDEPTAPQNHLPKIESFTANPNTVLINTETTLTCIATDEDGDNLTISWSSKRGTFSNGVVGISVKWVAPSTAGRDTINVTLNDGKQTIQVKLEVVVGTISASPTLLTPSNNATEIDLSPTLTWNAASNAVSYTLQVSTSNSFSSFVYNQSGLTNTSQQLSSLSPNTTYYWRVNSINNYGTSGWSSVFSFKTLAPPQAPTLLTPANSSSDVPLSAALSWNALSNATSYSLQVSVSNSFATYFYNQSGLTTTSQIIPALGYYTKYYWRVNSTNAYGTSSWSQTWSFTIIGTAPTAPILSAPINNATNISLSPTLSWNGSTYASSYTLQVSENSSFANYVYNQSGLNTTSKLLSGLNNNTKYYWRVSATNSYGNSVFSDTWSFITILTTPILLLPVNSVISISTMPTLSWNAVSGATTYSLQVSLAGDFSSLVYNQSGISTTTHQLNGLTNSTTYYWHVSAQNNFGSSNWSSHWSFTTINAPCPGMPTVFYNGKTYNTTQIGNQCWLKENLDVGTMINDSQNTSRNSIIEKYCYGNNVENCKTYGALYQWDEAMQYISTEKAQGICPDGWHIPTLTDFQTLQNTVNNDGNTLKAIGQGKGSGAGTNTSGFSALLAGFRFNSGSYSTVLGAYTYFWSSTEYDATTAYYPTLYDDKNGILLTKSFKEYGLSVRCIKN